MNSSIEQFYKSKSTKKKLNSISAHKRKSKVAIYRRVSTQEQSQDGQSIEAQKDRIIRFLANDPTFEDMDFIVEDYCDSGYSGKDLNRPAIQKLIKKIDAREIDYIIVVKLDRLSRHLPEMYNFMEKFNKLEIGFISINEKIDTKTAHGRFFIGILSSLSQLEREQTAERVQSVFKELIFKQPLGGKAPFGYFYFRETTNSAGNYYPFDEEHSRLYSLPPIQTMNRELIYPANYIPLIFSWYETNKNFRSIALKLTDLEIPTATQIYKLIKHYYLLPDEQKEKIYSLKVTESIKWNPRSIKDILTNPFYTGSRVWNRKDNLNKKIRSYEEWIFVPDSHKNLISLDTFKKIEQLIFI